MPLNTRSLFLSYTSGNFPTTCSFQSEKERSHKHGILPPPGRWMGDTFFALGGIYIGEPCWKRLYGDGCRFIVLRGIIQGSVVSIDLKENLPVVNINYLPMTYIFRTNYDICFKHDNCIVKLSLMPTSRIILFPLKILKSVIYSSLLLL